MKALGITHTPAVMLGTNVRLSDNPVQPPAQPGRDRGEHRVRRSWPHRRVAVDPWETINVANSRNKPFQQAISYMTGGHGAWGSVVIDDQGQIALNAQYAVVAAVGEAGPAPAAQGLRPARGRLRRWPRRLRQEATDRRGLPDRRLRAVPHHAGKYAVDIQGVLGMIRTIEKRLAEHGLYDMVVLDSVINATTSLDCQHWVLTAVNAPCRGDGTVRDPRPAQRGGPDRADILRADIVHPGPVCSPPFGDHAVRLFPLGPKS